MYKIVAALALASLTCCTAQKQTMSAPSFAPNIVVAHRGAFKKNSLPENSIASLKEAIRLNCTGSEFDIRMSADDSLVVNHDEHYKKMDIEKVTYRELAAIPLSNGEPMPTLRQYIAAGLEGNRSTRLVFEIKPSPSGKDRARRIAQKVVELIREMKAEHVAVYISFDYDVLKKVLEIDPTASTQYLNGDVAPAQLRADGITGADYHFAVFRKKPEWIAEAKKLGIALNVWTVNEEADMKWFIDQKFDFITTNEPERLLELTRK